MRVSGHHKLRVIEAVGRRGDLWESPSDWPDSPAASILSRSVRFAARSLRAAVSGRSGHRDARLRTGGKREDRAPALLGRGARTTAVAWVTVERGERDAQRFWLHLIDALADAAGDEVIERVSPAPSFAGAAVVERLLDQLERLEEPLALVIDDLHELDSDDALAWLEMLLTRLPARLRVVLATREEPTLGLHRLRLAGELTELRGPDLRFSLDETRALLRASGITLSDTGRRLAARTHRGMAGRFAPGGDLAGRAPRPGALRVRVLRQRADGGGLPPRRGAGAPAAGGARPALAHVDPRARQRPAGRCAHRRHGGRGDPPAARGPERLRHRARRRPYLVPLPPPVRRSAAPRIAARRAGDDPVAAPRRGRLARTGGRRRRSRPPRSSGRRLGTGWAPARGQLPHADDGRPGRDAPRAAWRVPGRCPSGRRKSRGCACDRQHPPRPARRGRRPIATSPGDSRRRRRQTDGASSTCTWPSSTSSSPAGAAICPRLRRPCADWRQRSAPRQRQTSCPCGPITGHSRS